MARLRRRRIAVIPGDGIGPEVIAQGMRLLRLIDQKLELGLETVEMDWGAERWLKDGVGLPKGALDDLRENFDAIYFGALGDPRIPDMAHGREILLGMRFGLDLFANLRPIRLIDDRLTCLKDKTKNEINFVVVRENTEDLYLGRGRVSALGEANEETIDESFHTRHGVERVIRFAFEAATHWQRQRVALVDKSNAVKFGGSLWQRTFNEVALQYPKIKAEHYLVDNAALQMVRAPEKFDVIVTSNLFGDILTDLGAGITGGLGLAASANLHPGRVGLFEPVHGSAPDIVGKGVANPMAAFLTAGMMLVHLEVPRAMKVIDDAVALAIARNVMTPDLGGKAGTGDVANCVLELVEKNLELI